MVIAGSSRGQGEALFQTGRSNGRSRAFLLFLQMQLHCTRCSIRAVRTSHTFWKTRESKQGGEGRSSVEKEAPSRRRVVLVLDCADDSPLGATTTTTTTTSVCSAELKVVDVDQEMASGSRWIRRRNTAGQRCAKVDAQLMHALQPRRIPGIPSLVTAGIVGGCSG